MDNVLQAVVDSIAESDNELAGQLMTRLRVAHKFGQNDASVATANPTRLTSLVDFFDAAMVGMGLDIILPAVGIAAGSEGSYIIASYIDEKNVTLNKIDGSVASFTDQSPVRWRFSTLKVETTLEFPTKDRLLQLYVGEELDPVPYAQVVQTPGVQEFRGLGAYELLIDGIIDSGSPNTLDTVSDFFTADYIGKAVWILKKDVPSGNEGPHLITAYDAGTRSVTLSPGGFAVNETEVFFIVKTYEESGYLTRDHREDTEVIDGSQSYSDIHKLRRSFLIDYAEGEELDRIGRNLAVERPRGFGDEALRRLLKVLPYSHKGTMYCLELVMEALFPGRSWSISEDLVSNPCAVTISIPLVEGDSSIYEGKAFLDPTGSDVTPPLSMAGIGRGSREVQTASSSTEVAIAHTPITVYDILLPIEQNETEMDVLPSVDTPAWTFNGAGGAGATEGQVFSISVAGPSDNVLTQTQPGGPTDVGGRYYQAISNDWWEGSVFEVSVFFAISSVTNQSGWPWHIKIDDDAIDAQYGLYFSTTQAKLAGSAGATVAGPVALKKDLIGGAWHHLRLRRETKGGVHYISAFIDGWKLFGEVAASSFPTTTENKVTFGYEYQAASTQNWTAHWDRVKTYHKTDRNYWNLSKADGAFGGINDVLNGSGFVSGDVGKRVRVRTVGSGGSAANRNVGLWQVGSYVSGTQVILDGILHSGIASVSTVGGEHFITLDEPWFISYDVGKQIDISGSILGNNGARTVQEYITPWKVRVDGSAFVSELELNYQFHPNVFVTASNVWYELIDAGSNADTALTVRESFPASDSIVHIGYTSVLSAQILKNTFITNEGSGGSEDNIYYPFYVFDVDSSTQELLTAITAAGVIPEYERV